MKSGLFGVSLPHPVVLGELLFGHFRGLLPLAPVLLLVPIGLLGDVSEGGVARADRGGYMTGVVLSFLRSTPATTAGTVASSGPLHLVAALPLAAVARPLLGLPGWQRSGGAAPADSEPRDRAGCGVH